MGIQLVVGLGNPGQEYAGTRHNVGFDAVDLLAGSAQWKRWREGQACQVAGVTVIKPLTYMNASGDYVQAFAKYFGNVQPGSILVVSDDMDLPLGDIRIRKKGSSGGQRGLDSILTRLGTQDVPRLRLGIGPRPSRINGADFVLGRFKKEEASKIDKMLEKAVKAILTVIEKGLDAAMNVYNIKESDQ